MANVPLTYKLSFYDPSKPGGVITIQENNANTAVRLDTQFSMQDIIDTAVGYKSYTALLTQSGTDAPVATVLKNDTAPVLTWARTAQGVYTLTASEALFTVNKTIVFINYGNPASDGLPPKWTRTSDTIITISTQDETAVADDGILVDASFEIRIY